MKFDNVFAHIGEFGRYHKFIIFFVSALIISAAFSNISNVFITGYMDHKCRPTEPNVCNEFENCWNANFSLPVDDKETKFINETQCRKLVNKTEVVGDCDNGWLYDRSQYKSTIMSEFDLVCEDSFKVPLASSLYLGGFFFGSVAFGIICDSFGRKLSAYAATILIIISGILSSVANSYYFFLAFRFISGAANIGIYLSVFTYVTEIVGPSKRAVAATIVTLYWCIGYMLIALIAYFIRSWDHFVITYSCLLMSLVPFYYFVPESARWLILKNRREEAKRVLQRFAKGNGVQKFPDEILQNIEVDNESSVKRLANPLILLRYPSMLKKVINITYSWFSVNLVYYGLTYGVESLNVNVYIGTFLGGLMEVFAYLFSWIAIQRLGRRPTLAATLVAGGVSCFTNIWISADSAALKTSISMIGKFLITSSFAIVYIYTAELFPTDIRTIGLGMCSFCARIAAVLAPQILFLEKLWTPLPLVTFSAASVSAGLLVVFLPETLNVPLPQTMEEAKMIRRNVVLNYKMATMETPKDDGESA